jgi:hypothetical protein
MAKNAAICYTAKVATPILARKGGVNMGVFTSFILSVMASVVAYYICKWLDGKMK